MEKFKQFNLEHNIPIMPDKTIDFLYHIFDNYQIAQVLEIGTAYGYSSKYLARHPSISKIITLENDTDRFGVAQEYFKGETKIFPVNISAFDYEPKQDFDCIIIDGPKSHQDQLFNKFCTHLKPSGFIFIDDINLFQNTNKEMTKNRIKLKEKVAEFKKYLQTLTGSWHVEIHDIDDGFAILRRKNENLN